MDTYYKNKKNKKIFDFLKIKIYSKLVFIILFILSPIILLFKNKPIDNKLNQFTNKIIQTPKIIADHVGSQVIQNIIISKKISEYNKVNYIFALQPSLYFSIPKTDMDKDISNSFQKYKNVEIKQSYKEYYKYIINNLEKNKDFKSINFLNLSQLFEEDINQNFIDSVHLGSPGQYKIAQMIGNKIFENERKIK